MGSICSSAQSNRDHDSVSNSESSPCYRGRQQGRRRTSATGHVTNLETKHDRNGKMEKEEKPLCETTTVRSGPFSRLLEESREESSFASESDTTFASPPQSAQLNQGDQGASSLFENTPQAIRHLPENVRQLIEGQINSVRVVDRGANVTLFIAPAGKQDDSSDVTEKLIDDLESYAITKGVSLQVSCLHHHSIDDNANDHMAQLSLSTLARLLETTYVLPVLFFTSSVGSPLLPVTIEVQDFQTALTLNGSNQQQQLLYQWYKLDEEGQPPCYRLQSVAKLEKEIEQQLLEVLVTVFSPELRDVYLTTLFEQVVHNSVCMSQDIARRCVLIQNQENATSCDPSHSITEQEYARKVITLQKTFKNLLQEKNIFKVKPDLCYPQLLANLQMILDEIVEDMDSKDPFRTVYSVPRPLLEEILQHVTFCQKAAVCSVNRESSLLVIKNYIMGDAQHPLIIHGPRGSGKTTLVARVAQNCQAWKSDAGLVLRFAGVSSDSRSLANLLHSVAQQCALLLHGRFPYVPHAVGEYKAVLQDLFLTNQNTAKSIIILLDGVDQLDDFQETAAGFWSWVPHELPPNMKLILTVHNDENCIEQLKRHVSYSTAFDEIQPLTHMEARNLFRACVLQHVHTVQPECSVTTETELKQSTIPLNVKILAWHSSLLQSSFCEGPDSNVRSSSGDFGKFLSYVEDLYGSKEVAEMLSFLSASRYGLSEREIVKITQQKSEILWTKLAYVLSPFLKRTLVGGVALFSWRDTSIRAQIIERYFHSGLLQKHEVHTHMLTYFKGIWEQWERSQGDASSMKLHSSNLRLLRRALDEIPFQMLNAGQSDDLKDLFHNFHWLLLKTSQSGINQVIEDLKALLRVSTCDQLRYLAQILRLSAPALNYDYRQLYTQLKGRVSVQHAELHGLEHWLRHCREPLVSCLVPAATCLRHNQPDPLLEKLTFDSGECCFNGIYRLVDDEQHAVALSTLNDEMSLWNFQTGECIKTLKNLHQPSKIVAMTNNKCVVLCGRELRVFDIGTGEEVLKLKGIMNQKLPLFGIHGESFVVSLSRNRMYVNLISLESGDCVTTFKVGEDRFLNSLLVSENGRILVCGDESKRPCSLLVWDLQARKLIYDLKMNHHEFITRNSAITAEGTYVCCVCKELETNDPNFIVVYDLQSGTLFKKWKAGVNTVALNMACQNTCVVSSLEDCRILVWDLVTGNCKWTLLGHTFSPDILSLNGLGNILLTRDSQNIDRSLRLWDLSNGAELASFTPDDTITAAQLSVDGYSVLVALLGYPSLVQLYLHV